ncbi:MAG: O-antigen ligase family protein [Elusimicrobia bacterium]|nr:O-antigen ligase family protein [Elusimicrobiota bacterium]
MKAVITLEFVLPALTCLFAFFMAPAISIGYFALGFLMIAVVVYWRQKNFRPFWSALPLRWFFLFYTAWGLVVSLCGIGVGRSIWYWRSDLLCVVLWVLYFLFKDLVIVRRWAMRGFTLSVALLALSGLAQFVIYNWAPSFNEAIIASPASWARKFAMLPDHNGRVHGPMHTMTYAEVMALAGLFVMGLNYKRKWLARALGMLSFAALLASGTRGPTLGFASGVVVIGFGYAWFHRRFAWKIVLPLVVSCAILIVSPFVWARLRTAFHPQQNRDRLIMWRVGWRIIRDHPVTGVGIAHIRTSWPSYFEQEWKAYLPYQQEIWSDVHSLYLQQAGERGIPGLAALFLLLGAMTWRCFKDLVDDDKNRDLHLSMLAAMIGFWVINITESAFQDTEVVFVLYLMLAFAWSARFWPPKKYEAA